MIDNIIMYTYNGPFPAGKTINVRREAEIDF